MKKKKKTLFTEDINNISAMSGFGWLLLQQRQITSLTLMDTLTRVKIVRELHDALFIINYDTIFISPLDYLLYRHIHNIHFYEIC